MGLCFLELFYFGLGVYGVLLCILVDEYCDFFGYVFCGCGLVFWLIVIFW